MVTFTSKPIASNFNGNIWSVKFNIDCLVTTNSTAKIVNLGKSVSKENISWNGIKNIPAKKVQKFLKEDYFSVQITELDGGYKLIVTRKVREVPLFSVCSFNGFKKLLEIEGARRQLYPVLSTMRDLFNSSSDSQNSINKKQLLGVINFLKSEDQPKIDKYEKHLKAENGYEDHISGTSLFALALRLIFPWAKALYDQLEGLNKQLIDEDRYRVPLNGRLPNQTSGSSLGAMLEKLLYAYKRIVILGPAGSGKSLFFKTYVRDLLKNYRLGEPLPFYIALDKTQSQTNILQECLKKLDLIKFERDLKKKPTLWLLDGYDELIAQDRKNLFNIFTINRLDKWPMAKFVFSCRDILEVGEEVNFAPPDKIVALIYTCPLNAYKVMHFFKKYASSSQTIWTPDQYRTTIQNLDLEEIIKHPLYLKWVADYLPRMPQNIEIGHDKQFFIWGLCVCGTIWREFNKIKGLERGVEPLDYLNYILEVARLMNLCGVNALSSTMSEARNQTKIKVNSTILAYQDCIAKKKAKKELLQTELENCAPGRASQKMKKIEAAICQYEKDIEEAKGATLTLHNHLLNAPWKTEALLALNSHGQVGFAYPFLKDFLVQVNENAKRRRLLIEQFNSFAPEENEKTVQTLKNKESKR